MENQQEGIDFPDLHQGELSPDMFAQLLDDLESHAEVLLVTPKYAPQQYVAEHPDIGLREAADLLAAGQLSGLQVRYRFQNAEWWDTLMRTPTGIRLIRIQPDF